MSIPIDNVSIDTTELTQHDAKLSLANVIDGGTRGAVKVVSSCRPIRYTSNGSQRRTLHIVMKVLMVPHKKNSPKKSGLSVDFITRR